MAMNSFLNSGSWNFLEVPLSNRLPSFDTSDPVQNDIDQTFRKKVNEATNFPFTLGIAHIADIYQDGTNIELNADVEVPFELRFVSPHKDLFSSEKQYDSEGNQVNWYDQLRTFQAGTTLYDVMALDAPLSLGG